MIWQLQEAKSKFSKLVNLAVETGPQVVTRHGKNVVVVLSMDEYESLRKSKPSLLSTLLNSELIGSELEIPARNKNDYGRGALDL